MFASILAAGSTSSSSSGLISILFLVVMVGLLYMVMIRPQQRRARQQKQLQSEVGVGDEVVTIGGIYGEVTEVDDETVVVEIADGVEVRFIRNAIARKLLFDDEGGTTDRGTGATAKDQGASGSK